MSDSRKQPELETKDYKPTNTPEEAIDKLLPIPEQPAKSSPETLGMNSHVIKPGARVNKAEVLGYDLRGCTDCETPECCEKIEQPNLKIIDEIEGLVSQVNEKLDVLDRNTHMLPCQQPKLISTALEEIDLFQKTTLFELRRTFE